MLRCLTVCAAIALVARLGAASPSDLVWFSSSSSDSNESSVAFDNCSGLPWICDYSCSCRLGYPTNVTCHHSVPCVGQRSFLKTFVCQYCFQTPESTHICARVDNCRMEEREYYVVNCTVPDDVFCLGPRAFSKAVDCRVVSDKSWGTALLLSALLGGFAADRFYLGHVGWGMFKLLTLGGFGVWALVDIVLVGTGFLKPVGALYADGVDWWPFDD
eukprot:m51a1_g11832 hypothetical protein (216) ;mRNA; f:441278-442085